METLLKMWLKGRQCHYSITTRWIPKIISRCDFFKKGALMIINGWQIKCFSFQRKDHWEWQEVQHISILLKKSQGRKTHNLLQYLCLRGLLFKSFKTVSMNFKQLTFPYAFSLLSFKLLDVIKCLSFSLLKDSKVLCIHGKKDKRNKVFTEFRKMER